MKTLVTGARKGLGAFLAAKWQCDTLNRDTHFLHPENHEYDLIVHCAFNTRNSPADVELTEYFEDNIILTHDLLKVKSKRFVFISSIDVYPEDFEYKHEEVEIDINEVRNIYGQCKLACEDMVSRHPNYLILRCGGIIGPNKIPKSIRSAIDQSFTSLTKNSTVNYVHQQTIADIIETPNIQCKTVNVVSDTPMVVEDLREIITGLTFGIYEYHATNIITARLKKLFPNVKIPPSKNTLLSVLGT